MSPKKETSATAVLDAETDQDHVQDTKSEHKNEVQDEAKNETKIADQLQEFETQPPATANRPAETGITIDDSKVAASYANFCRVSSTPEELILDLGLNPRPMDATNTTVEVSQRVILNHYTAKRLLSALSMALQRHEQVFGVLETDIRKRIQMR